MGEEAWRGQGRSKTDRAVEGGVTFRKNTPFSVTTSSTFTVMGGGSKKKKKKNLWLNSVLAGTPF